MTTKDSFPPYSTINTKLAEIVAQVSAPPSWHEAWRSLGPKATGEDRLTVYRAIRDAGSLPPDAGFYLVAWQTDMLTSEAAEEELRDLDEELEAIRRAHGLDELERWPAGQEPVDYRELDRQYMAAYDDLFVRKLKQHDEHDMARLFRTDRAEFDRLLEEGRKFFHESENTAGDELRDWLPTSTSRATFWPTSCFSACWPMLRTTRHRGLGLPHESFGMPAGERSQSYQSPHDVDLRVLRSSTSRPVASRLKNASEPPGNEPQQGSEVMSQPTATSSQAKSTRPLSHAITKQPVLLTADVATDAVPQAPRRAVSEEEIRGRADISRRSCDSARD